MKTIVIVQARMTSTRLPGKVMMPIADRPMIEHVLARTLDPPRHYDGELVFVGPQKFLSVPYWQGHHFEDVAKKYDFEVVEGPHPNLLRAYWEIARDNNAEIIIRITGDCWSICPEVSREVLDLFMKGNEERFFRGPRDPHVYAANIQPHSTWPDGLDTEVFSMVALEKAYKMATALSEHDRHHVTPWIRDAFVCRYLPCPHDFSSVKLSVDTQEDLDRAKDIAAKLPGVKWNYADLKDVLLFSPYYRPFKRKDPADVKD